VWQESRLLDDHRRGPGESSDRRRELRDLDLGRLDPGELAPSRRVVSEHGNCSSATILLVVDAVWSQLESSPVTASSLFLSDRGSRSMLHCCAPPSVAAHNNLSPSQTRTRSQQSGSKGSWPDAFGRRPRARLSSRASGRGECSCRRLCTRDRVHPSGGDSGRPRGVLGPARDWMAKRLDRCGTRPARRATGQADRERRSHRESCRNCLGACRDLLCTGIAC
jgi:hypothetical protein